MGRRLGQIGPKAGPAATVKEIISAFAASQNAVPGPQALIVSITLTKHGGLRKMSSTNFSASAAFLLYLFVNECLFEKS
jgi:hypothetical protein